MNELLQDTHVDLDVTLEDIIAYAREHDSTDAQIEDIPDDKVAVAMAAIKW